MDLKKLIPTLAIIAMLTASSMLSTGCKRQTQLSGLPQENGTIELYFSKSDDCKATLEGILQNASGVRAALYDLDVPELIGLAKSKNADILVDEDNYFGYGTKISGEGLMHNKFWLIDYADGKHLTATGSLNPTLNDIYKNDNNLVIISSDYIRKNYEAEFNELKRKGRDEPTIYQNIIFNSHLLENYFCPDDDCEQKYLNVLKQAKEKIYFMDFSFTSDALGDYLMSRKSELDIRGVFDESQVKSQASYTEYYRMLSKGMNVRLDGNPYKLHHKVFIIDNDTVILGSTNPTSGGFTKNDENVIIYHDPEFAAKFLKEFDRVWALAKK